MNFQYKLINTEQLTAKQIKQIEAALAMQAYVCQQEFEKVLDLYHQINVLMEADDEAFISRIEIKDNDCYVELDCSKVIFTS